MVSNFRKAMISHPTAQHYFDLDTRRKLDTSTSAQRLPFNAVCCWPQRVSHFEGCALKLMLFQAGIADGLGNGYPRIKLQFLEGLYQPYPVILWTVHYWVKHGKTTVWVHILKAVIWSSGPGYGNVMSTSDWSPPVGGSILVITVWGYTSIPLINQPEFCFPSSRKLLGFTLLAPWDAKACLPAVSHSHYVFHWNLGTLFSLLSSLNCPPSVSLLFLYCLPTVFNCLPLVSTCLPSVSQLYPIVFLLSPHYPLFPCCPSLSHSSPFPLSPDCVSIVSHLAPTCISLVSQFPTAEKLFGFNF